MTRIVSVWLPAWPIERLRRQRGREHVPADRALALVGNGAHGLEITAVNEAARGLRIRVGASLADTRAALPALVTLPAERERDRQDLLSLSHWCGRYGPARHVDGEDGLWIDITGVAHLFAGASMRGTGRSGGKAGGGRTHTLEPGPSGTAGERALLADLVARFSRFGLTARVGLGDTLGAAHAAARFATTAANPFVIVPPGRSYHVLAPLPVAALRLDADAIQLLERLGLRTIGQLYDIPRPALERRFRNLRRKGKQSERLADTVLRRLDQALGRYAEPRAPLAEPPDFAARLPFSDPLVTAAGIETALDWLCRDLARTLERAGVGGRRFRLTLYRADGSLGEVTIGTSAACRDDVHIRRLLSEKIANFDAGFGIDLMTLDAIETARLDVRQQRLDERTGGEHARVAVDRLVDRLSSRLGTGRVLRLAPRARHIPEAAQIRIPALVAPQRPTLQMPSRPALGLALAAPTIVPAVAAPAAFFGGLRCRPPLLLDPPEPIAVLAAVPEGAPMLVTWRRVRRRIVRAEGPERIAPAWWESLSAPATLPAIPAWTRDYYLIEETAGARYWVFRAGFYGAETHEETGQDMPQECVPRWFMHGVLP